MLVVHHTRMDCGDGFAEPIVARECHDVEELQSCSGDV